MTKNIHRNFVRIFFAASWMTLITGCDLASDSLLPVDLTALSTDVNLFIQQLTQEAITAFLF